MGGKPSSGTAKDKRLGAGKGMKGKPAQRGKSVKSASKAKAPKKGS